MQTINERFLIARKEKGLSQEAIGKLLHISGTAYSRIENGVNNPSAQTTSLMCSVLNVSEEWLKTGNGDMFTSSADDTIAAVCEKHHFSPVERKMLEAFIGLEPKYRDGVLKYIESLVASIVDDSSAYQSMLQARADAESEATRKALANALNEKNADNESEAHA